MLHARVLNHFLDAKFADEEGYEQISSQPQYLIQRLDEEGIEKAVLIAYPAESVMGYGDNLVDYIANYAKSYPERLLPTGGIDVSRIENPISRLEVIRSKYEAVALKLHPVHQLVKPNAYRVEEGGLRPLEKMYEYAQDYNMPVLIHTGTSIFPGSRIKYGDPIFLDDVATDFPKLQIVMCHGGRPFWYEEAFFLMRKHSNIFLDISGIPPKKLLTAFPRLAEFEDRVIFGSDWPSPGVKGIRQNVEEVKRLPLNTSFIEKILFGNAEALLH